MLNSRRAWKFFETTLVLASATGLGLWGWATASRVLYQEWGDWSFHRQTTEVTRDNSSRSIIKKNIANNELIGKVEIPRLGVNAVVREGTGEATLRVAAGHISGTAMPGDPGNVAVAAHRDSLFRGLRNIRKNDVIVFESAAGRHVYQVDSTAIVKPQDVWVLNASSQPELTLITCYPFSWVGFAPERFVVKAREASSATPPPVTPALTPVHEDAAPSDPHRVYFQVALNHSRELAPGISLGLSETDVDSATADGWMWLMPDRRTIWLRQQSVNDPLPFYPEEDGRERDLVITKITSKTVSGYLQLPDHQAQLTTPEPALSAR